MTAIPSPHQTAIQTETQTAPAARTQPQSVRPSVSGDALRTALGRRASSTAVVTTADGRGNKYGLTATAVTSVSLDPPLVLVCVNNEARSAACALSRGYPYIIHFLGMDQGDLAWRFASRQADKFADVPYAIAANGCPRLSGVLAAIECAPHANYPGGDHTIFVGRVVDVQTSDCEMMPLIYYQRQFLEFPKQ